MKESFDMETEYKLIADADFAADWGTPEQKTQLAERRKRMDEWLKDIPILTIEEAMKRSFNTRMPE